MKDLEWLAIFQMLENRLPVEGHNWVRSVGDDNRIVWCAWCGQQQVEVGDWKDNPECPALEAARKIFSETRK